MRLFQKIRMHGVGEYFSMKLAWLLPRRVALWAMIRVASHASTGRWGNESPDQIDYAKMHDRWGII